MSAFADLAVCIPTVPERAAALAATLAHWAAWGVAPLVETQPGGVAHGHVAQRATAERALGRALATGAGHLLFCEDDVDLAPALPARLPALIATGEPVTLFLSGRAHYPAAVRRALAGGAPLAPGVAPVIGLGTWYGTQAILLPRATVAATLAWPSARHGWDAHLQAYLRATGRRLLVAVPNLAQHRGVRPVADPRGGKYRSVSYGR